MSQKIKNLAYMLNGFMDFDKDQDNLDILLGKMNESNLWNVDFKNYNLLVDWMISADKSFTDLEFLNSNQIEFLVNEVEKI